LQPNGRGRFTRRRKLLLSHGLLSFVNSRSLSLSLSLSLSVNPNPKIPCSHGEDLFTCIILNIKDCVYIYRPYNKTSGGFARSCVLGNCLPLFYCSNSLDICQYSSLTDCILLNTFLVSHHLDSFHLFKPS